MNIEVYVKGGTQADIERIQRNIANVMSMFGLRVVSRARVHYLGGPKPVHLDQDTGTLWGGIFYKPEFSGGVFSILLGVPGEAKYGAIWEGIGEYETRIGQSFANGTPMWRPFFLPALQDMENWLKEELTRACSY